MKVGVEVLKRYVAIPDDTHEVRMLLDDVGVEVKRAEQTPHGAVFTVELLANRGDHYCYAGIAREISARTSAALHLPGVVELNTGGLPYLSLIHI